MDVARKPLPPARVRRTIAHWIGEVDERDRALAYFRRKTARLEGQVRSAKRASEFWRVRWASKCPKGHLRRYDECDLMCEVTVIEPYPTPFVSDAPRVPAKHVMHAWNTDMMIGWWWRVPYQWWLRAKKFIRTGD